MMSYAKMIVAAIVVGFLAWTHILVHKFGADGVRLETAQQALKQIERAQDETRSMQEKLNAAQQTYQQAQADIGQRDGRIRALNDRMRNAPTADQLASATLGSVSRYAAEADRDFAECRDRYAALGSTAAKASAAAWAHRDAWPTFNREAINQSRNTLRTAP
jgi:chromosome segregation ATPase